MNRVERPHGRSPHGLFGGIASDAAVELEPVNGKPVDAR
jgi:hypothetical protein